MVSINSYYRPSSLIEKRPGQEYPRSSFTILLNATVPEDLFARLGGPLLALPRVDMVASGHICSELSV